jgi:hypothetical protein
MNLVRCTPYPRCRNGTIRRTNHEGPARRVRQRKARPRPLRRRHLPQRNPRHHARRVHLPSHGERVRKARARETPARREGRSPGSGRRTPLGSTRPLPSRRTPLQTSEKQSRPQRPRTSRRRGSEAPTGHSLETQERTTSPRHRPVQSNALAPQATHESTELLNHAAPHDAL